MISPTMKTFRELYCERRGLDPSQFGKEVLRRSLYPHARLVGWLLCCLDRNYFAADRDFIGGAGGLSCRRDFRSEMSEYFYHPGNRGFLRRVLRLRVSAGLLRRCFEEEIDTVDSRHPFDPGKHRPTPNGRGTLERFGPGRYDRDSHRPEAERLLTETGAMAAGGTEVCGRTPSDRGII